MSRLNDANTDRNVSLDGPEIVWAQEMDPTTTVQWSVPGSGTAAIATGSGNGIVSRARDQRHAFYCYG